MSFKTKNLSESPVFWEPGLIKLLPALSKNWPAGSVKGIRTRGGFEMDMEWKEGKLTQAVIHSLLGNACKIYYGEEMIELKLDAGESYRLEGIE